jgi:murein DD-endopeptidase
MRNTIVLAAGFAIIASLELEVRTSPTPVAVDGTERLVYELHLTNVAAETITVRQVRVLDADRGTELAAFGPAELDRRIAVPGVAGNRRTIPPQQRAVAYLEVSATAAPQAILHRLELSSGLAIEGARVSIAPAAPVVLSPPLRGGPWVAIYDPAWERGHRRVFYTVDGRARIPGRHAIDFMKVDARGTLAAGDSDEVSNWRGYGAEVLAVADGEIVATRDGMRESALVSGNGRHEPEAAAGNYIGLDLGRGRYAFYEHLKPGSVRVRPGDRVRRGQVIAALGFTGSATGPHLHFHVADGRTPLGAEGLPFVFREFELLGRYESLAGLGREPWTPVGSARRVGELPGSNTVVRF